MSDTPNNVPVFYNSGVNVRFMRKSMLGDLSSTLGIYTVNVVFPHTYPQKFSCIVCVIHVYKYSDNRCCIHGCTCYTSTLTSMCYIM